MRRARTAADEARFERTQKTAARLAPAPAKRQAPKETVEEIPIDEFEQGSPEWFACRIGIATASNFGTILAQSDEAIGRTKLLHRMAAEVLSGEPIATFQNDDMRRGNEMEPKAIDHYLFAHGIGDDDWRRVAFVKRTITDPIYGTRVVGCSPDLLIREDKVVQIKTKRPDLIVELVTSGRPFPSEHRAQCQGEMWVTGRTLCDLLIFYEGMPIAPVYPLPRDQNYIDSVLAPAVEKFQYDLEQLLKDLRKRWGLK